MLVKDEVSYHTAYELLEAGSKVQYDGYDCFIHLGLIHRYSDSLDSEAVPYHSTFHHVYDVVDDLIGS